MPYKKIIENLYLGDQFSNINNIEVQLQISNIYYDMISEKCSDEILNIKPDFFVRTKSKLALNLYDSHDSDMFSEVFLAPAIKFINEKIKKGDVHVHCQLGVSRSASIVFIYLVINKIIKQDNFNTSLREFLENYYPYMKVNYGIYNFLKENYPYDNIKHFSNMSWKELECIT